MLGIFGFSGKYRFLSNFYPCPILYNGVRYSTAEHAYQAQKCLDESYQSKISECETPGQAKRLGAKAVLRSDWYDVRVKIMEEILTIKFSNQDLRLMLTGTEDLHIEETNSWGDTFWGVCDGVGSNLLGKLLMKIRSNSITSLIFDVA